MEVICSKREASFPDVDAGERLEDRCSRAVMRLGTVSTLNLFARIVKMERVTGLLKFVSAANPLRINSWATPMSNYNRVSDKEYEL